MQFAVDKDILENAVSRIIKVCERTTSEGTNSLPYFFHIRIDGYGTALKLSAGNAVRSIEILIPGISEHQPFCFGIYGDYFNNILKAMPGGEITFSIGEVCYMHNNASTLKFQILGADQFPLRSDDVQRDWLEVDYRELFTRFKKIMYCADLQSSINKNYLKGVCILSDKFACTDNRRLSLIPNTLIPSKRGILLPIESINAFSSLFDLDAPGFVHIEELSMAFTQKTTFASTRLLSYDAPKLESGVPQGTPILCVANRQEILSALKRAVIVAKKTHIKEKVYAGTLVFTSGKLHLSLDNQGFGIHENIEAKYFGPNITIQLNLVFLFQALKSITDEHIIIEIRGDNIPIVVTEEKGDHKNVILPIITQRNVPG